MMVAAGKGKDGRKMLIVGMHEENMRLLRNDRPIEKPLDDIPGLEGWVLYVLGPEDLSRFVAHTGGRVE